MTQAMSQHNGNAEATRLSVPARREKQSANPPLHAIFGTGRCGSTWLGAMVNSHPDIAYRFEPFTRLLREPRIESIYRRIESGAPGADALHDLYQALLPAHPALDKPPFFPKSFAGGFARRSAWALTAKVRALQWAYALLYSPRGNPVLIFKEVSKEKFMIALLRHTDLRIVYQVRHPCAVVASMVRGQAEGVMGTGRLGVLTSKLREHDTALADRYAERADDLSPYQQNALLWRMEVEETLPAVRDHPNVCIIVYEALCGNPGREAMRMFDHFGIAMHDAVLSFIEQSTTSDQTARRASGESFVKDYFSVFRSPAESIDKWKTQLTAAQQREILDIVEPSDAWRFYHNLGHWR